MISAGVGRTGVFCALSVLIERLKSEGVVDVFQTVKQLRSQRPAMVQTKVYPPCVNNLTCVWLLFVLVAVGRGNNERLIACNKLYLNLLDCCYVAIKMVKFTGLFAH